MSRMWCPKCGQPNESTGHLCSTRVPMPTPTEVRDARLRAEGAAAERARLVAAITGCVRVRKAGLDWIHLGEALERMGLSEAEIAEAMGAAEGSEGT